jgi:small-conductance mechanosensitive channel
MPSFSGSKWIDYSIFTVLVLIIAFFLNRLLRFMLTRYLKKSSEQLNVDPTNYTFFKNALNLIFIILTISIILYTIPELKRVGITVFAGAGIFAAIVGFASQAAFSNIVSGVFIVLFKPFRVGDIVQARDRYTGVIEDITLRHTVIRDFENRRYVIPNSIVSNDVIHNSSLYEEETANHIFIGIGYDSDLDKAIDIIRDEAMKHPALMDRRTPESRAEGLPVVDIRVLKLNEYSVDLRATCWTANFIKGFDLKCDLNRSIKLRFDNESIEIPFPHRTIVTKHGGKVI